MNDFLFLLFGSDRSDALSVFQVLYAFYHDFIAGLQAVCNVKIFAIIQAEYVLVPEQEPHGANPPSVLVLLQCK